jgi:hypothetical protein
MAQKRGAFPAEKRNQNEKKNDSRGGICFVEKLAERHGGGFIPADDFGSHRRLQKRNKGLPRQAATNAA